MLQAAQGRSRWPAALDNYDAWATGLRRAETNNRVIAPVIGWDAKKGKVKVSPLARWSDEQMERYIAENGVLVNPLVYDGYPSIGCCALHPAGRARRGPAQRALGRHQQDRVRDPLTIAAPSAEPAAWPACAEVGISTTEHAPRRRQA